jgi:hypothetical protein
MRHSLTLLEAFILRSDGLPHITSTPSSNGDSLPDNHATPKHDSDHTIPHPTPATVKLETQTDAGLYAGPTSSAVHLVQHEVCPPLPFELDSQSSSQALPLPKIPPPSLNHYRSLTSVMIKTFYNSSPPIQLSIVFSSSLPTNVVL